MSIAALRKMADLGLTLEQAIEVMEAMGAEPSRSAAAERQARYRARGGDQIPPDMRAAVFDRDGHQCQECGGVEHLHCDHVIPVSKGGLTEETNLQVLCRVCNSRKRDRIRKSDVRRSEELRGQSSDNSSDAPLSPSPPPQTPPPRPHTRGDISTRAKGPTQTEIARGFAAFWAAYPKRVGKDAAAKSFASAMKRVEDAEPLAVILAGLERALPGWDDPQFIPNPATWLNQGRWTDDAPAPRTGLTRNDRPANQNQPRSDRVSRMLAGAVAAVDGP